ncbi:GGDEF domain-containing protein [Burkholderia sp. Ac-20353]|uniref:GGDEF domain-containing protein n=1 Tax=Burkholderia sp. Ac-20353 TaxID=2703894 RepID=UPI00197C92B7|nr:GGDEF domain-containing protein [Burkholderia sp. Ac-20353]MBN3790079.1 GGDEF domain-containing protein [Burkholderia sp. Ac-20353]
MSTPAVLLLVLLINCVATSAVLGSLWRADVPGVRRWLASQALLAMAVGALLAAPSSQAVIAFAGTLYVCATLAILQGFRQFFGVRSVYRAEQAAAALLAAAVVGCALAGSLPNLRIVLVSTMAVYVRVAIGWLAYRRRPVHRPAFAYGFVWVVAIAGAIVQFARGAAFALGQRADTSPLHPAPLNVVFVALGVLSLLCLSMGVVMLAHDRMAERLERLATIDGLTGALMRGAFLDQAEQCCRRAARTGAPLSLVIVDLDHFKIINDRHGHAAGDHALEHFAAVVSGGIRPCDLFGRLGGEEFAVLCADTVAADATRVIERLRVSLAHAAGAAASSGGIGFTFSAGVAERAADEPLSQLMARADAALYAAKAAGRDRVIVAPVQRAGVAAEPRQRVA